jgi:hypothetical protein
MMEDGGKAVENAYSCLNPNNPLPLGPLVPTREKLRIHKLKERLEEI